MLGSLLLSGIALFSLGLNSPRQDPCSCLPKGINRTDVVSTREVRLADGRREKRKTTIEQKLRELNARCKRGKLVDAAGTEIRFYQLTGCWGSPSPDDREVRERQNRELAALKKRYRVVEMNCNPAGEQIPTRPDREPVIQNPTGITRTLPFSNRYRLLVHPHFPGSATPVREPVSCHSSKQLFVAIDHALPVVELSYPVLCTLAVRVDQ